MTKQAYQLFLAGCISILLAACQSQIADSPDEEVDDSNPRPVPQQGDEPVEIDQTFVSRSGDVESDALSLYTFSAPESESSSVEASEVFASEVGMTLSLDTSSENGAKPDVTILVSNDSVYKVDHESSEVTQLRHFKNEVCEILPKEVVTSSIDGEGSEAVETYKVMHDESIYVVTAISEEVGSACTTINASRSYYELPLNYRFDAPFGDDSATSDLPIVDEATAKARLVFGWVESPLVEGQYTLNYGYLGYSFELRKLEFFNQNRESVWEQTREVASYPSVSLGEGTTPLYLFDVQALDNYQYLIQLNQDVFVVDASTELFAKRQSDSQSILTDRAFKLGTYSPFGDVGASGVYAAEAYHDDDDLIVIDQGKIYQYQYQENAFTPADVDHAYLIDLKDGVQYQGQAYLTKKTFSQFDYFQCSEEDLGCIAAHDIESADWQFITACDLELGCNIEETVADLCETQAELDVSQSGRDICSPEFYQHIEELNISDNDAELVGYMQYLDASINHYQASLLNDSILFSASMLEKDVIIQYFYQQPLTAPKSLREHILFGADSDLFAMDHFVENENLFINALVPGTVRSNECYKNHTRVNCELGAIAEGGLDSCTLFDLQNGLCYSEFTEFESTALFCSQQQLLSRTCTEEAASLSDLRVENEEEDGKWVRFLDLSGGELDQGSMFLLKSLHSEAVNAQVLGEGNLLTPMLYEVDDNDGVLGQGLGILDEKIETAVGGVLFEKATGVEPLFEGLLDLLTSDASVLDDVELSGTDLFSRHSRFALVNTLSDENNALQVSQMRKLTDTVFDRVDTTPKSSLDNEG